MPKGVICAGAVEGSNQLGAIVTCHAMTARPAGAGPSAAEAAPAETRPAANSEAKNAGRQRRPCNRVMRPSPLSRGTTPPDLQMPGARLSASRLYSAISFGEVPETPPRACRSAVAVAPAGRPAELIGAERPER